MVTGASGGIGRGIALRLAADHLVLAHYGREPESGAETVRLIESMGGEAIALGADLTNVDAINELFDTIDAEFSACGLDKLDVLVNNAGISSPGRIDAFELFEEAERYAAEYGGLTPELAARVRQAATWTHHACGRVSALAHLWGGTQAFRNPSVLGRIGRDAGVLTQHLLIDNITLIDGAPALIDAWRRH